MIDGILGKKIGMTSIFSENGAQVPVTVIKTDSCFVVQRKVSERDGYEAVQLGVEEKKDSRATKAMRGHFKKAGTPCLYRLVEFRCAPDDEYKPGQAINCADLFKAGDFVDIKGTSKGKGFQGSMKRWGFGGGKRTHGSMHGRGPGSIGQSSDPSRVFKGMRMAGHMGDSTVTIQNLKVVDVKGDENLLLIKGSVPGAVNGYLMIKKALKKTSSAKEA